MIVKQKRGDQVMKKSKILLAVLLCLLFVLFAVASGDDSSTTVDQGSDSAETNQAVNDSALGDYSLEILDSRMAKDFEGKDVIIVKYKFTNNNNDTATAFFTAFEDAAFQNGIGLNEAFVLDNSANYSADNQTKEIKKGASLEIEVAYELNDTTSDVVIEVSELFSLDDKTIQKTFKITE